MLLQRCWFLMPHDCYSYIVCNTIPVKYCLIRRFPKSGCYSLERKGLCRSRLVLTVGKNSFLYIVRSPHTKFLPTSQSMPSCILCGFYTLGSVLNICTSLYVGRRKQERLQKQQQQQQLNQQHVTTAPGATTPPSHNHHKSPHSDASSVASSSRSSRSPWSRDPAADARPIADPKLRKALGSASRSARVNPRVSELSATSSMYSSALRVWGLSRQSLVE